MRSLPPVLLALALAVGSSASAQGVDTPPSTPGNLTADAYSGTVGEIRWSRSTDDRVVVGYAVTRDGAELGTFDALSYVDRDLTAGRDHRYTVTAVDDAGQRSGAAATTLPAPGGTSVPAGAPAAPAALIARTYSATAAELFWTRPAASVVRHEVRRFGELGEALATVEGNSYFDDTLRPGREYRFEVVAIDGAGRRSGASTLMLTVRGDGRPPPPFGLRATRYGPGAGEIFWPRSEVPGLRYEVSRDGEVLGTVDGTSFYDGTLELGRSYRYEVISVDPFGRRSQLQDVRMGNGGVLALADAEQLAESLAELLSAQGYGTTVFRLHRALDGAIAERRPSPPPVEGEPTSLDCPRGGALTFTRIEEGLGTTTDYVADECGTSSGAYSGEMTYTSAIGDPMLSEPTSVPEGRRSVRTMGPLVRLRNGVTTLNWEGEARATTSDEGMATEFDIASLDGRFSRSGPLGEGTVRLRDLDLTIVCRIREPLRIEGRFEFALPLTGDRLLEVRILEPLLGIVTPAGERGLTGRISVEDRDGSRMELDWRDGDGSSFRISIENGALSGELALPTEPFRARLYRNSLYVNDDDC